jgi:GNAT superfamily N-acetyltransferase
MPLTHSLYGHRLALHTGRMTQISVRPVQPGDGFTCAQAWMDAGRYYTSLDKANFQIPTEDGLAEWFENLNAHTEPDELVLVGCIDDHVAGFVAAHLSRPDADAHRQLARHLSVSNVIVNALAVAENHRRAGVGSALMLEVERWAREQGAHVISLDTNIHSPLSVSFYENRMNYTRSAFIFRKSLRPE